MESCAFSSTTFADLCGKGVVRYAGIAEVVTSMQEYCINREDLDFLIDVTKFKTKADWNEDPMKDIPPGVKSSFTRCAPALRFMTLWKASSVSHDVTVMMQAALELLLMPGAVPSGLAAVPMSCVLQCCIPSANSQLQWHQQFAP